MTSAIMLHLMIDLRPHNVNIHINLNQNWFLNKYSRKYKLNPMITYSPLYLFSE